MRFLLIILSICIWTSCSEKKEYTLIKGTIKGEIPNEIFYTLPVEGICNRNFVETIKPDSFGNFSIKINNTKPLFLKISTKRRSHSYFLIAEPSNYYEIELEISQEDKTDFINKKVTDIQTFYDGLPKEDMMNCRFFTEQDINNYIEIIDSLNHELNSELSHINQLKGSSHMSQEVYELIKQDRKVYYATMICRLISACNFDFINKEHKTSQEILKLWENAISKVDLTDERTLQAVHIYDLLDFQIWYKMYQTYNMNEIKELRANYRKEGLIHSHTISLAKEYLPVETLEFYIASYITFQSNQIKNQKEKELIEVMQQYKLDYPQSPFINSLENKIERIRKQILKD
nr:hypothetical protein [uncultured Carboxylicivirga sp.]